MESVLDTVRINFDAEAQWVLNGVLALVMFGIALEISVHDFKALFKNKKAILTGVASQFVFLPLVTFVLVYFIEPIPSVALGMFMVAACPGGNVSNFFTNLSGGNSALSIGLTAIATLLAVFMTSINLQFWGSLYEPTETILRSISIDALEMVKLISLLLGLPLVAGIFVNHRFPTFAQKSAKVLKMGSLVFFMALVGIALYVNRDVFLEYIHYVFGIVLLHNLIAFSTGFSAAKVMGLDKRDVRAITIETGIQNSGLGLLLIFSFFDGLGGMAVLTAFWGIWHLVSGLVLGGFWGLRPVKKEGLA